MADIRAQMTRVREVANDATSQASDKIRAGSEKAREGAGELIQTGKEKASEAYDGARDRSQKVAARANEIVQDHPIVAVAGAVAAGAVIAWMFPKSRAAMKALPGLATTLGARAMEAAVAARSAASDGAHTLKAGADHVVHVAGEAASTARKNVSSSDLTGKASHVAEDVVSLVSAKIDALAEAVKARLPKS